MNYQYGANFILVPIVISNNNVDIYVARSAISGFWASPANVDQSVIFFAGIGQFTVRLPIAALYNLIAVPIGGV